MSWTATFTCPFPECEADVEVELIGAVRGRGASAQFDYEVNRWPDACPEGHPLTQEQTEQGVAVWVDSYMDWVRHG